MPATLTNPQPMPAAPTALTEVLIQTITSNAQILRLLDPARYRELLKTLPAAPVAPSTPSQENLEPAGMI